MTLEKILEKTRTARNRVRESFSPQAYNYLVDVASGWAYYTPVYAIQEALCGNEAETIVKTRLIGLAAHMFAMRPIGMLRNYMARKYKVSKDSSFKDKLKVNLSSITPIQAVVYAGMLSGGATLSNNYDLKETILTWGIGVGLGALHAFPSGWFQDKFRKVCGVEPAIK